MDCTFERLQTGTWNEHTEVVHALASAYSVDFWSQTWKELLAVRDSTGNILAQFGTVDMSSAIFPPTQRFLNQTGISSEDPDWPVKLWERAGEGDLLDDEGRPVTQYWSLDASLAELRKFVASVDDGGCGGEILVLMREDEVVGFTAFACLQGDVGRRTAHLRYPVENLYFPLDASEPMQTTIERVLGEMYPGDLKFGIFLDHAISQKHRGAGLGSRLFDARLERLLVLGAQVIFGRTQTTARPQYEGNYLARGLRPFAADVANRDKHYFAARSEELRSRQKRTC